MNIKTKDLTVCAVALALMFALGGLPVVFLVPVLFIACTQKWHIAAFAGLAYGGVSLLYAFLMPSSPVSLGFIEQPWIAVVPRIFVGLSASFSFKGFKKLFKGNGRLQKILPYSLAASIGTLTNTALVVSSLVLTAHLNPLFGGGGIIAYVSTMLVFGVIELAAMNLIIPTLCLTVGKALKIGEFTPRKLTSEKTPKTPGESKESSEKEPSDHNTQKSFPDNSGGNI